MDEGTGAARVAFFEEETLSAALFISSSPVAVARDHLVNLVGKRASSVLAARPGSDRPDPGPTVCSCLGVGRNTILAAALEAAGDLERVWEATGAGTNCGSCRPEVADLVSRAVVREPAE